MNNIAPQPLFLWPPAHSVIMPEPAVVPLPPESLVLSAVVGPAAVLTASLPSTQPEARPLISSQ